jgi:hypothetical protein
MEKHQPRTEEQLSDDADSFFARHAAGGPSNIVLAFASRLNGGEHIGEHIGVFSTIDKARAWADTLNDDECEGVVFCPFVIDAPEYGNLGKRAKLT